MWRAWRLRREKERFARLELSIQAPPAPNSKRGKSGAEPVKVKGVDLLSGIIERKRREVARLRAHLGLARLSSAPSHQARSRGPEAIAALRRDRDSRPRVIAEIKLKSPSAGVIRKRAPGLVGELAYAYAAAGAAAVSVQCDGPGFGGSPLDLRRASRAAKIPLLFKEFVLDETQIWLARELGAHMVLLLARALSLDALPRLAMETVRQGMAPLVEAADERELERALAADAGIIGINARDLRSFCLHPEVAARLVEQIPKDRIAVYMSGIAGRDDYLRLVGTRADAVLIGESLMRAPSPAAMLSEILK